MTWFLVFAGITTSHLGPMTAEECQAMNKIIPSATCREARIYTTMCPGNNGPSGRSCPAFEEMPDATTTQTSR